MPRRKYKIRQAEPDVLYRSVPISKLINLVMHDGKKTVAQKQVYQALENLKEKEKLNPVETVEKVVSLVGPKMTVRPRRIGGASYMVPKEITSKHRVYLALSWLVAAARARSNKEYHTFADKLAAEIKDVLEGKGAAVEKKVQTEKQAEANRVFAHFGW